MTKQEAAAELGVSVRALERYTQQSRIVARYEKGRTRSIIVYDEAEVERFKSDLEQVKHRPALERPGTSLGSEIGHTFEAGKALNFANDAKGANSLATSGEIMSLQPNAPALALLFARFLDAVRVQEQSALAAPHGEAPDLMSASLVLGLGTPAPQKRADKPHTPTADKILLSVEDAMSLTTLPRLVVLGAVKTGQLPAQKFGRAWKIKRRDLDAWIDHL